MGKNQKSTYPMGRRGEEHSRDGRPTTQWSNLTLNLETHILNNKKERPSLEAAEAGGVEFVFLCPCGFIIFPCKQQSGAGSSSVSVNREQHLP